LKISPLKYFIYLAGAYFVLSRGLYWLAPHISYFDNYLIKESLLTSLRLGVFYLVWQKIKVHKETLFKVKTKYNLSLLIGLAIFFTIPLLGGEYGWIQNRPLYFYGLYIVFALILVLMEEMLFRAYLIRMLTERGMKPIKAILIAGFIYTLFHLGLRSESAIYFVCVFFVGTILGLLYIHSHSIWPCLITHALYRTLLLFTVMHPFYLEFNYEFLALVVASFFIFDGTKKLLKKQGMGL
jgi:membrane protease YdiL (CAAX protease family)